MQTDILDHLLGYIANGGFIMPPLVAATLLLWFGLGWRLLTVQRGSNQTLRQLVDRFAAAESQPPQPPARGIIDRAARLGVALRVIPRSERRGVLDEAFGAFEDDMNRFSSLVRAIVVAAPLAGLLGTVTGMIETFDSLATMSLFTQTGGIAGGISVALISTQMGLAVAIPGFVVGRVIDRRAERLGEELDELKEILCGA